jgi:hypothetical protein
MDGRRRIAVLETAQQTMPVALFGRPAGQLAG